jgi:hypothetical protein
MNPITERSAAYYEKRGINRRFYGDFVSPMIIKLRGNKCELCSSDKNLETHHTSYILQNINTIRALCRKCHILVHKGKLKAPNTPYTPKYI